MTEPEPQRPDEQPIDPAPAATPTPARRRSPVRVAVQLLGFGAGIALLWWCVSLAFQPENREQLQRLADADAGSLVLLFGMSLATLVINGLIFWVAMLPDRRLDVGGVLSTNAIGTLLSYLPFKLSVVLRFAIHNRRDGVPILTIAAWFGAIAATTLIGLGPMALASIWRGGVDPLWWAVTIGGTVLGTAACVVVAGYFAHDRGLGRLHRVLDPLLVGPLKNAVRGDAFRKIHGVFDMLAHPWAVSGAVLLRLADLGSQAVRFAVAASILGVDLSPEHTVLIASTYFLIGMLSPFGMLGTREAGSIGVAGLIGIGDAAESLAVVVLAISATESLVNLAGGALGVAYLRPDRLIRQNGDRG